MFVQAGGLFTNCLNWPNNNWGGGVLGWDDILYSGPLGIAANSSFTFRVWSKSAQVPGPGSADLNLFFVTGPLTNFNAWQNGIGESGGNLNFVVWDNGFNNEFDEPFSNQNPLIQWNRYIFSYDNPTKTMRCKFNNEPTVTMINPLVFFSQAGHILEILWTGLASNRTATLCEAAFWINRVLTETEMLNDWQSGHGITWPW